MLRKDRRHWKHHVCGVCELAAERRVPSDNQFTANTDWQTTTSGEQITQCAGHQDGVELASSHHHRQTYQLVPPSGHQLVYQVVVGASVMLAAYWRWTFAYSGNFVRDFDRVCEQWKWVKYLRMFRFTISSTDVITLNITVWCRCSCTCFVKKLQLYFENVAGD